MDAEYDPRLSKARAEYLCTGSRNNPCAKKILPGERYFVHGSEDHKLPKVLMKTQFDSQLLRTSAMLRQSTMN